MNVPTLSYASPSDAPRRRWSRLAIATCVGSISTAFAAVPAAEFAVQMRRSAYGSFALELSIYVVAFILLPLGCTVAGTISAINVDNQRNGLKGLPIALCAVALSGLHTAFGLFIAQGLVTQG